MSGSQQLHTESTAGTLDWQEGWMGWNRGAPKDQKKPSLSATGFSAMPGALALDSTDAVRSWAPASRVVGGRKGFISLPGYEGIRLCWVKRDL